MRHSTPGSVKGFLRGLRSYWSSRDNGFNAPYAKKRRRMLAERNHKLARKI